MECMGGKEKYIAKLDSMFSEHRYWHGNEPCHQIAYLFNYAGQPWKTQREVRHIMETEYLNAPVVCQVMMMQDRCLPGMYFLLWDSIRYVPVHLII